jgi:FdhD protein
MLKMNMNRNHCPEMGKGGPPAILEAVVFDQLGKRREIMIPNEFPLTIKVNGQEIVTLMTLGTHPEALALGYLRNQLLIDDIRQIESINIDWDSWTVNVVTSRSEGMIDFHRIPSRLPAATGCGQGTVFSCALDALYKRRPGKTRTRQSTLFLILKRLSEHNLVYKKAGSVHGCGLFQETGLLMFVEDVSRNNAADVVSGKMMLEDISGENKILYTTGRLTSEIVIKVAHMRITQMALELAQDLGITVIGRAKGNRLLVFNGEENIVFDLPST